MAATGTIPVSRPTTASTPSMPTHRPGPVIALLVVAAFVVILNETTMSVALPAIMADFGVSAATGQWLTSAFLLTMAVVIPLTGFLLERFPIRVVFFSAMGVFAVGTLVAAVAPAFGVLLAGRIIQAMGTGVMMPLLFTTVLNLVPANRRGRVMGVVTIVIAVAPAVGPTVSGLILSALTWHAIFWLILPIALVAIALGARWVRNVTETRPDARFDVLSVVLSAIGFGGLVYGLSAIGESASGHASVPVWIPLAVGAVFVAVFVLRQLRLQRSDSALLDLRVFLSPSFRLAVPLVAIVMAALFGSLILLPIFLQQALGLSSLTVGLMLLPGGVLMGVMAPIVGRLFDRFGPTPLVIPGMLIAAAVLWTMALTFGQGTPMWWIVTVYLALNLGLGLVFTPLMTSALGSLPRRLYSHGSAVVGTAQQVAGAAGTAGFVAIMTVFSSIALAGGTDQAGAVASGVHASFLVGAVIATAAVVLACFVRKPAEAEEADAAVVAP
ncbi:MDR family MFS transporter [Microbacterium sp. KSW4-17]|uniref:MDR family MFS transporter n=1 Tax=Microbacterium galbum TaxID=3075994 RepID=A0ABU3T9S6_9MICO|nr:MDR family MFS transporter [Microbacterium sp. KSW4-17]MDU0368146.1 MDR family MFS transporter [Microbacterium sp. KSW4-17]